MSKTDVFKFPLNYFFVRNQKNGQTIVHNVYDPIAQTLIQASIQLKQNNTEETIYSSGYAGKQKHKIFFIRDENDTSATTKEFQLVAYPNNIGDSVILELERKYNKQYSIKDTDITTPYDDFDKSDNLDAFKEISNDNIKKELIRRLVREHKKLLQNKTSNEKTFSNIDSEILYETISIINRIYDHEVVPNIRLYSNKLGSEAMHKGMLSEADNKIKYDMLREKLLMK